MRKRTIEVGCSALTDRYCRIIGVSFAESSEGASGAATASPSPSASGCGSITAADRIPPSSAGSKTGGRTSGGFCRSVSDEPAGDPLDHLCADLGKLVDDLVIMILEPLDRLVALRQLARELIGRVRRGDAI